MKITIKQKPEDPPYPIMAGDTAAAKEFNRRQKTIWQTGNVEEPNFEQVVTVLLEILIDDYNKRHASRKRRKKTNE